MRNLLFFGVPVGVLLSQSRSLRSVTLVAYLSALARLAPKKRYQRFFTGSSSQPRRLTPSHNSSNPVYTKNRPYRTAFLVYPLRFELRIDGVGGRNVIQLHYEYVCMFRFALFSPQIQPFLKSNYILLFFAFILQAFML